MMMIRSARPSRTDDMKAVSKPFFIKKGYDALTFFGYIITHSTQEAEAFNRRFDSLKNHEMIHLYQARTTHDSWLCFYARYLYYWLTLSLFHRRIRNAGYLLNPFEMEAYHHMNNLNYLKDKHSGTNEWRRYAAMSVDERLRVYFERNASA